MNIEVVFDVTLFQLVNIYRRFGKRAAPSCAVGFFATSLPIYQTTCRKTLESWIFFQHCFRNHRSGFGLRISPIGQYVLWFWSYQYYKVIFSYDLAAVIKRFLSKTMVKRCGCICGLAWRRGIKTTSIIRLLITWPPSSPQYLKVWALWNQWADRVGRTCPVPNLWLASPPGYVVTFSSYAGPQSVSYLTA
jgi:hypothetical protein